MSIRKVSFASGEYYHLYNRGNSKQTIFHDEQDYLRFITLLYTCNSVNRFKSYLIDKSSHKDPYLFDRCNVLVSIGAYVLMPNHFHVLITEATEGGVSKFMQKLSTGYSMYYNKKYNRSGSLFEGKFKSEHLDKDRYLKYIFSYIHLNPLKLFQKDWKEFGIKKPNDAWNFLITYKHSSLLDLLGFNRKQSMILSIQDFPNYFPNKDSIKRELFEWINYKDKE